MTQDRDGVVWQITGQVEGQQQQQSAPAEQSREMKPMNLHTGSGFLWITLLLSHHILMSLSLSQTCSEDGVCVAQDDVIIPKYANKDGKPVEASDDCYDRHEQCNNFVKHGECKS